MNLQIPETFIAAALAYCLASLGAWITGRRLAGVLEFNREMLVGLSAAALVLFPLSVLLPGRALPTVLVVLLLAAIREVRRTNWHRPTLGLASVLKARELWLPAAILAGTVAVFLFLNVRGSHAWDGFQIWATKARFLHDRGGLTPYFFIPGVYERMVDYPPMVPLYEALVSYARGCFNWDTLKAIFPFFLLSLHISTYQAALPLVGRVRALWGAALVALIPGISMLTSAGGYADMPQAALLAAVAAALLTRSKDTPPGLRDPLPWLLAGTMMVKNEGEILFLIASGVILLTWRLEGGVLPRLRANLPAALLTLSAPALRFLLLRWNQSQDIEFGMNVVRAVQRWKEVPTLALSYIADSHQWGLLWPAFALALVVIWCWGTRRERLLGIAGAAALFGYTVIFYFTNWTLGQHMDSAYLRILSQLAPLVMLCLLSALRIASGMPAPKVEESTEQRRAPVARIPRSVMPLKPLLAPTRMDRLAPWLALLLVLLGAGRIALTWPVLSETWDEPGQIACGLQYLTEGRFDYVREHPPLSRVAAAVGPWLTGASFGPKPAPSYIVAGLDALYSGGRSKQHLILARAGILPFFLLGAAIVWIWARRIGGPMAALAAVFLFTTAPPVLAHAGLATTDMAAAATLTVALYALARWWEEPTFPRSLALGGATALTVYSKYSALGFLPAAGLVLIAVEAFRLWKNRKQPESFDLGSIPWLKIVFAGVVCLLLLWGGFRFSFDHMRAGAVIVQLFPGHPELAALKVPMPELFDGILEVINHNSSGHPSYLLGAYSLKGWWYFFPIVLLVKTPIPLLLLGLAACLMLIPAVRRGAADFRVLEPLLFAGAVMAVAMASNINLGVRHILAVYPLLAIAAGTAAAMLLAGNRKWPRIVVLVLLAWQGVSSLAAHPDYLAWFNGFVQTNPENVLVDSDFDWGQDLDRLAVRVRERGIRQLSLIYFGSARAEEHGFPALTLPAPGAPDTGWVAISVTNKMKMGLAWKDYRRGLPAYGWLDSFPVRERIGHTILLYWVPPDANPR